MRRPPSFSRPVYLINRRFYSSSNFNAPIISIQNGIFYRQHPSSTPSSETSNPPLFPNLNFNLPSTPDSQHWTIVGPSSSGKTTFLEILRGQHLSIPPTARSFPYLSSPEIEAKDHRLRFPGHAIQYVGFGGGKAGPMASGFAGAYLSARYESRREETDFSLLKYLKGETDLNPPEERDGKDTSDDGLLERVVNDLALGKLLDMSVGNLSNGQTRRARIARALLGRPEVLLLDEPFMGLDPQTLVTLSVRLERLAKNALPRLVIALRPQDPVPEWITHLLFLQKDCKVAMQGEKADMYDRLHRILHRKEEDPATEEVRKEYELHTREIGQTLTPNGIHHLKGWVPRARGDAPGQHDGVRPLNDDDTVSYEALSPAQKKKYDLAKAKYDRGYRGVHVMRQLGLDHNKPPPRKENSLPPPEPLVEMNGIRVAYGPKIVLGDFSTRVSDSLRPGLHLTIRRGSRWGIFGSNGSGKTTLLSLLTSDHPQTYSLPITHFSRPRLHTPGFPPPMSLFDLQRRIGHSSPEIHAFFPRHLTIRQTLESAFAETFRGKPYLDHERDLDIDAFLRWFEPELNPAFDPAFLRPFDHSDLPGTKLRRALRANPNPDTDWAESVVLGSLPLSGQRVALFLRALVKRPDLLILDEALSGMDDFVRDKCLLFLQEGERFAIHPMLDTQANGNDSGKGSRDAAGAASDSSSKAKGRVPLFIRRLATQRKACWIRRVGQRFYGLGERQALVVVSHVKEEVPGVVREWICLPDGEGVGLERGGKGEGIVRMGRLKIGLDVVPQGWDEIWGVKAQSRSQGAG